MNTVGLIVFFVYMDGNIGRNDRFITCIMSFSAPNLFPSALEFCFLCAEYFIKISTAISKSIT